MLNAADLAKPRLDQARDNHETYKCILQQCFEVIRACNARRIFQTTFAVPTQVVGRPHYKHAHAVFYVHAKLRQGRFDVRMLPPTNFVLFICWHHTRPTACRKK